MFAGENGAFGRGTRPEDYFGVQRYEFLYYLCLFILQKPSLLPLVNLLLIVLGVILGVTTDLYSIGPKQITYVAAKARRIKSM